MDPYALNCQALLQAAAEAGVTLDVNERQRWSSYRVHGDPGTACRVYLDRNGVIRLNRVHGHHGLNVPLAAEPRLDVEAVAFHRYKYFPANPGGLEWVALFTQILAAEPPGVI